MVASSSDSEESSFSERCASESLRVWVSVWSWSRSEKARANEASMAALSVSSCGGVGGEMRGRM